MPDVDPGFRLLVQLTVILTVCRLLGMLGRRLGQAQAVCDMIAGIALGPSLLGLLAPTFQAWLFPQHLVDASGVASAGVHPSMTILYGMSQFGLVLYMFLVGLEFDSALFVQRARGVMLVSGIGVAVPFALGAAIVPWLAASGDLFPATVTPLQARMFIGACMAITAFPVLARILDEKGATRTAVGTVALSAGAADDVIAWTLLAVIVASLRSTATIAALALIGGAAYVLVMGTVGRTWLLRFGDSIARHGRVTPAARMTALTVLMMSAGFTAFIGLHSVFGAFLAGVIMPRGELARDLRVRLADVTTLVLLPLFFVYSGLNTRLALLSAPRLWMVAAVIITLAMAGKGLACTVAARWAGVGWREAAAVGVLMNARGLVELVMLNIGLQAGLIGPALFTIMVTMAVSTTLVASPLFDRLYLRATQRATPPVEAALASD
jgi:Kef-type K+ transport system membrane component KefB